MAKQQKPNLEKLNKRELIGYANELLSIIEDMQKQIPGDFVEGYTEDGLLNLLAEIKTTKQHKASDLTQRYTMTLETNNPNLLDLGKLPYESIVEVTFNLSDNKIRT